MQVAAAGKCRTLPESGPQLVCSDPVLHREGDRLVGNPGAWLIIVSEAGLEKSTAVQRKRHQLNMPNLSRSADSLGRGARRLLGVTERPKRPGEEGESVDIIIMLKPPCRAAFVEGSIQFQDVVEMGPRLGEGTGCPQRIAQNVMP